MKEFDLLLESDGKLFPIEIKKTAIPDKRLLAAFKVLDKQTVMKRGNGAIICMAESFMPVDRENFLVPVSMI